MDYSYLNHHVHHHQPVSVGAGFDPSSCAMPGGPDGGVLAACSLTGAGGPYGDLAAVRCGPAGGAPMGPSPAAAAAYGAYGAMRGHHQYSTAPPPPPMSTGSCSMIPRPRDHPQAPTMFATGECITSFYRQQLIIHNTLTVCQCSIINADFFLIFLCFYCLLLSDSFSAIGSCSHFAKQL